MRTIETQVFQYEELSDKAKEKAREWFREARQGDDWWSDTVFDDAVHVASLMGIEIGKAKHRNAVAIYFSGFWSQGDGASFEGSYSYAKGAVQAIKGYAPQDAELLRIAKALQDVQRKNFYSLEARVTTSGRYSHSNTMDVEVTDNRDEYRDIGDAEEEVTQLMRDFADWIYKELRQEFEYKNSDEQVAEIIAINEYEFTEDGERA